MSPDLRVDEDGLLSCEGRTEEERASQSLNARSS